METNVAGGSMRGGGHWERKEKNLTPGIKILPGQRGSKVQ